MYKPGLPTCPWSIRYPCPFFWYMDGFTQISRFALVCLLISHHLAFQRHTLIFQVLLSFGCVMSWRCSVESSPAPLLELGLICLCSNCRYSLIECLRGQILDIRTLYMYLCIYIYIYKYIFLTCLSPAWSTLESFPHISVWQLPEAVVSACCSSTK